MAYNKIIFGGNTLIDLTGDDVTQADVLAGKQFHGKDGETYSGSMPNRGAVSGTIATASGAYTIPQGYHNGSGNVQISAVERAKIIAENIKNGVSLLGVLGTYTGEAIQTQTKTVTPTNADQTVTPDSGYYLSSVLVKAIPYEETANTYGITVTIG